MAYDLFGPIPRKPPVIRMKSVDQGEAGYMMDGWKTSQGGHFRCWRCGHDDGWTFNLTVTEIKRGLPCPQCNEPRGDTDRK